jgi:hypothetical protein
MKKNILLFMFYTFCVLTISAQIKTTKITFEQYKNIPKERIFVQMNTPLLFVGEYLYYKAYCIDISSKKLSELSKIGYVELINENKDIVFRHKILLENGLGSGDYFIPTTIPSGNYKLLAYTNWMKNETATVFFQNDIKIINPYKYDQNNILNNEDFKLSKNTDSVVKKSIKKYPKQNNLSPQIILQKDSYKKRDLVSIESNKLKKIFSKGHYSISVRKLDTIAKLPLNIFNNFYELITEAPYFEKELNKETFYLPELRGEIITGRVQFNEEINTDESIVLSIPGDNYQIYYSKLKENGNFLINLDKTATGKKAILQLIAPRNTNFNIFIDSIATIDYSSITFSDFYLTPNMENQIVERSVHNQIENAFKAYRPDTTAIIQNTDYFKNSKKEIFVLNDYKSFDNTQAVFTEIITRAQIRNVNKKPIFNVAPSAPYLESNGLPLIILDGLVITNHEDLFNYNPKNIEKITIVRDNYIFGLEVYHGVIVLTTTKNGFEKIIDNENKFAFDLFNPQPIKNYFKQSYKSPLASLVRLPDDRTQLLWTPNYTGNDSFEFYTSDVTGIFEIIISGITEQGVPVFLSTEFIVEKD